MKETSKNKWLILAVLAMAQFMIILDSSIVNVALPTIQHVLKISTTNLQWIVTAYTLTFGGFLLLGGRAADLFGRRRIFIIGLIIFSLASLADGMAVNGTMLIFLRGAQGLAGAFMSPSALSIVLNTFTDQTDRNKALSVWGAVAAGGAGAGVLLGGLITQYLGWRWNFFVNVPIGFIVLFFTLNLVPKHISEETERSVDFPGAIFITGAMMLLVYGLVNAPTNGWTSSSTLIYIGISLVLFISFIFNESRVKKPLVPLSIFRIRNLTGANLVLIPIASSMFSLFFFMSLYIQDLLGFDPVRTGVSFIIVPVVIAITAISIPTLMKKFGYKRILMFAPLLISASFILLSYLPLNASYLTQILPAFILLSLGAGMSFVCLTIAATTGVPPTESGLASSLINSAQQIGGSLGLAIFASVASSRTIQVLHQSPIIDKTTIASATLQGYHTAFYVGAGFAIAASVISTLLIREHKIFSPETEVQPAIA